LETDFGITKPTDEELRGEAAPASEPTPAPASEPTPSPASEPTPAPASEPTPAPAAEEAASEIDYAALYEQEKQSRERERAGLLRQLQEVRFRQAAPDAQQVPQQQAQPQAQTIPLKFDAQGNAYIDAPVPPPPQPLDPLVQAQQRGEQLRREIIMEDPVQNAAPMNRVYQAYLALDQLVGARLAAVPAHVRSIDDVIQYVNAQGLDREIAQAFPDVVRTYSDLELLIEAGTELSERKIRRLVRETGERIRAVAAPVAAQAAPGGTQPAVPAPPRSIGDKPRSQAQRGTAGGGAPPDRLAELDAKDPWKWTREEGEEYARLSKGAQGAA
jgi:hypothetical protein